MTYIFKDSMTYETWHSIAIIGETYYNLKGWEKLSRPETRHLFEGLKIVLDESVFEVLYGWLKIKSDKALEKKELENE